MELFDGGVDRLVVLRRGGVMRRFCFGSCWYVELIAGAGLCCRALGVGQRKAMADQARRMSSPTAEWLVQSMTSEEQNLVHRGENLEKLLLAKQKGINLTDEQAKLVDAASKTLSRQSLEAYKYLLHMTDVMEWFVENLNLKVPSTESGAYEAFGNFFKDGRYLCQMVNLIDPDVGLKFNELESGGKPMLRFRALENIWLFLDACKGFGLDTDEQPLFLPTDLFEHKNIKLVVDTLVRLAQYSNSATRFKGIKYEPKAKETLTFSDQSLDAVMEQLRQDQQAAEDSQERDPKLVRSPETTSDQQQEAEPEKPDSEETGASRPGQSKLGQVRSLNIKQSYKNADKFKKKRSQTIAAWDADKVARGLYLGSVIAADNKAECEKAGVTHILRLIRGDPTHPNDFTYKMIDMLDSGEHNLLDQFDECCEFIAEGRTKGAVLVHCQRGVSRSTSIVIAYLMSRMGYPFDEAAELVAEKRPSVCPNLGFITQLQLYEKFKFNISAHEDDEALKLLRLKSLLLDEKVRFQEMTLEKPYVGSTFLQSKSAKPSHTCKSCSKELVFDAVVFPHASKESCDVMFSLPLDWMNDLTENTGVILCDQCKTPVGRWNWDEIKCGCGLRMKPAVAFNLSAVNSV